MQALAISGLGQGTGFQVSVDQVTEAEWNGYLPRFRDANLYQTWAYGAVSWGRQNLSHLLLRNNHEVVGMAQFRIIKVPLISSGIAYLRWGPLYRLRDHRDNDATLAPLMEALTHEYARRRRLLLRIVPNVFQDDPEGQAFTQLSARMGYRPNAEFGVYRTVRVDLTGSPEQMRKQLDQKWRNQLNSAERNGLQVVAGTSEELFERFVVIYRELLERKQFETTVDIEEFRRIQRALPEELKMRVLLCEKEGKLMAGLVATGLGDAGIYLLGATSADGMKSKGAYLLQWQMMQFLKERGCRAYDLGGINPERNPGVYHFKSGFGGVEISQCPRVELSGSRWSTWCVASAEHLKGRMAVLRSKFPGGKALAASH